MDDALKPLHIYLIAGEASGDLLGAHLMRALKKQSKRPLIFSGVGGDKMIAEGLKSLFPFYELSMLGFLEILPYLYNIFARIGRTVEDICIKQPDIVVTIDVPGFSFRVVAVRIHQNLRGAAIVGQEDGGNAHQSDTRIGQLSFDQSFDLLAQSFA